MVQNNARPPNFLATADNHFGRNICIFAMRLFYKSNLKMTEIILYYIAAINLAAFIIFGIDKLKAKRNKWRISEPTLLLFAVVGGSVGAWVGMKVFHHKTLHKKFKYGVPAILLIQIALVIYLYTRIQ